MVSFLQIVRIQFPWSPLPSKCMILRRVGRRERQGSSLWSFAYPHYQCLLSNEKGKLDQACNPFSRHSYHPPHRSITWLIFKIYRHTLTAKLSGHLDDSNIKQHKDVPCPKGFLSPFKSFFKCTFKVDFMPSTEGHPNKVSSGIKRKKLAMPTTSQHKNISLLLSEIQES